MIRLYGPEIYTIYDQVGVSITEKTDQLLALDGFANTILIIEAVTLAVAAVVFYIVKLQRAVLPYVSFLRLNRIYEDTCRNGF